MKIQQKLEQELSRFLGLKNAVLFSSCRNALYTLLLSLDLKKDDEIIVQKFICDSVPNAVKEAGGKPVLVEVSEETFNLNPKLVENEINSKTKAIIFVHTYGNPSGILEIKNLCDKYNLILIEDIAHALGASYDGKLAGTFGDYAVYSFTKQMVNFGGGALITNKEVEKIRGLRDKLHKKPLVLSYIKRLMASLYETRAFWLSKVLIDLAMKKKDLKLANELDTNFRCNAMEAYLALKQIKSLPKNIKKRKINYKLIKKVVKTQKIEENAESSYNYLSFIFDGKVGRDEAVKESRLLLSPWPGSKISDKTTFVPNNPNFRESTLISFMNYNNFFRKSDIKNNKKDNNKNDKLKVILLALFGAIFLSVTQVLYKLASNFFSFSILQITNFYLMGGLLSCFVGGFLLLLALKKGELSLVYPITAFNYVLVTILSYYFLNEILPSQKWIGLGLITLGVIIIGKGERGSKNE